MLLQYAPNRASVDLIGLALLEMGSPVERQGSNELPHPVGFGSAL